LSRVSVTSNVVVMWFQNRRAKDRAAGIAIWYYPGPLVSDRDTQRVLLGEERV
jgi:hypothetical protein